MAKTPTPLRCPPCRTSRPAEPRNPPHLIPCSRAHASESWLRFPRVRDLHPLRIRDSTPIDVFPTRTWKRADLPTHSSRCAVPSTWLVFMPTDERIRGRTLLNHREFSRSALHPWPLFVVIGAGRVACTRFDGCLQRSQQCIRVIHLLRRLRPLLSQLRILTSLGLVAGLQVGDRQCGKYHWACSITFFTWRSCATASDNSVCSPASIRVAAARFGIIRLEFQRFFEARVEHFRHRLWCATTCVIEAHAGVLLPGREPANELFPRRIAIAGLPRRISERFLYIRLIRIVFRKLLVGSQGFRSPARQSQRSARTMPDSKAEASATSGSSADFSSFISNIAL